LTLAAPQQPAPDDQEIQQRIALLEGTASQLRQIISEAAAGYEDQQRSWIARTIIWIFVAVIIAGLIILLLDGILTNEWKDVTTQSIDLIKSAVLPIVTLVLGYYFGRAGKG
jgi:VIT1/CCC1 family predicted Fe2+/Mn2+ transporter